MAIPATPPAERSPDFLQLFRPDSAALRAELVAGLLAERPRVAPKFLYDALGSRLFDAITVLREYYPTRTEAEIFRAHAPAMAAACGTGRVLVDLGAGDGAKAARLFPALQPTQYVAVDISVAFLRESLAAMQRAHPALPILGLGLDFSRSLSLPDAVQGGPRTLFYPGSSIGNFSPGAARDFLSQVHQACQGGSLLIGVDLVKDRTVLEAAYDDPLGVTAAFNLNLLRHVAGLLDAEVDERQWAHVALYDADASRIEMHLQARGDTVLAWPGGQRRFHAGDRIHTENSYKYTVDGFRELLRSAGFGATECWQDERGWFAVFAAQA